jgi:hypothetical protein
VATESVRARLAAATPGPWETVQGDFAEFQSEANYDLIAHAPADLALALDVIEAAKRYVDAWNKGRYLGPTIAEMERAIERWEEAP